MKRKNTKLKLDILLSLLVLIMLMGCSGTIQNDTALAVNNQVSDTGALKVALLLPGPIDDQGWSQSGYEGLKVIEQEVGAYISYSASVSEDKEVQADLVRQYAEDGYDLIMGHGGEYRSAFETVSEEYPNIQFALVTSHPGNNKNLGGLAVRADESGYLAGVLAALKTETGKVAYIGGEVYPSTTEEATAFEKGAKDTNPEVTVSIVWVESWSDQRKAQGIAEDLVADDIDVLAVDADLAGLAALQVAEKEGIMAIGWVSDQSSQAPNAIIGSVVQNMSARMTEAAVLVEKGRWEGKQYRMGIQEGVIDLIVVDGVLTAEEDTQIATIKDDIITGQVDTLP